MAPVAPADLERSQAMEGYGGSRGLRHGDHPPAVWPQEQEEELWPTPTPAKGSMVVGVRPREGGGTWSLSEGPDRGGQKGCWPGVCKELRGLWGAAGSGLVSLLLK